MDERCRDPPWHQDGPMTVAFDLNSGEVLEHWPTAFAVREIIANALDEQVLTGTQTPDILRLDSGRWSVRDYGRGIRYHHLTQAENDEKLSHPGVIGKFGFGLNDALAVLDRKGVGVAIRSKHGVITTSMQPKAGFSDVVTLHGIVGPPDDPDMVGTEVIVDGVDDAEMATAKAFFLRYSGDPVLEENRYGQVIAKPTADSAGAVYVKGLRVADEPRFLFSYNVTSPDAKLSRALNRERSNVGRSAYSERVKDILKSATGLAVIGLLTADIAQFDKGEAMHDELRWKDVAIYACQALQGVQKTMFVTAAEMADRHAEYARADGYAIVVVPNDIARALAKMSDLNGTPMVTLGEYERQRAESFEFDYVTIDQLNSDERAVFDLGPRVAELANFDLNGIDVRISNTMRPGAAGAQEVGLWNATEHSITVKRTQLRCATHFCGTLLHEICHAMSGETDRTLEFEGALTDLLGVIAGSALGRGANGGGAVDDSLA